VPSVDPHQFDPLIHASAGRWGRFYKVLVPEDVVRGIINAESAFNTNAVRTEPDGRVSRGLMQVLEDTARALGLEDPKRLHDPLIGIDYGVKLFAKLLSQYQGDTAKAVSAFNAGRPRYTDVGAYANQAYIDKVLAFAGRAAAAVPPALLLVVGVLLLTLWFTRRGHRDAAT
jgi:soluble lytic murein transglycosylase-like protein